MVVVYLLGLLYGIWCDGCAVFAVMVWLWCVCCDGCGVFVVVVVLCLL